MYGWEMGNTPNPCTLLGREFPEYRICLNLTYLDSVPPFEVGMWGLTNTNTNSKTLV